MVQHKRLKRADVFDVLPENDRFSSKSQDCSKCRMYTRYKLTKKQSRLHINLTHARIIEPNIKQEAQLPQRNSASAAHVYCLPIGWLTDRAMHRTPQNRRGCIIFWHSNALIQEMLAKNGFWHEIATQGHSRSFILQSVTGRQGVAYRHILCLPYLKLSKT